MNAPPPSKPATWCSTPCFNAMTTRCRRANHVQNEREKQNDKPFYDRAREESYVFTQTKPSSRPHRDAATRVCTVARGAQAWVGKS